ncbi:MAG: tetratricopeptide repeat protein [Planctomycetes bacterium]|nr:tetratricopeptide repeat protein [Planctomycetota bacterium]
MTELTIADLEAAFNADLNFETYPALRDAALSNQGNARRLEELCEGLDESNPKQATKKGVALSILGRMAASVEALEKAHPKEEVASVFLGRVYLNRGDYKAAKQRFHEAINKHPDSQTIAYGLIHATLSLGEHEAGSSILKRAQERFGENSDTLFLVAFHSELTGEYEEARKGYEKVLEQDPTHPQSIFRLARYHQTWGEEEKALELYETLRDLQPTYVNALLNLGNLYEDYQQWERAIECYTEVLKAIPNHPRALVFLGDARASKVMYYDEDSERRADRQSQILKIPVTDFELSVRSRNCLNKMNVRTLGDLIQMTEHELLAHKNFGETSLMEVKQMLAQKGLRLGQGKMEGGFVAPPKPVEVSEETLQEPIESLDLSVRSRKCMERLGITSIGQLITRSEPELLQAKNFGQTSLNEIKMRLEERGLRLKDASF